MYYVTYAKPKKISNKLMDNIVVFAYDFLNIEEIIEIDFDDDFEDRGGYCDFTEDEIIIGINPKQTKAEIIRTLFHEMVHVKQYVRGQLLHNDDDTSMWNGRECDLPYWERPWEKEAYEYEDAMWDIFSREVLSKMT
jgi:hypothetical protein|tara:strand:- start:1275 stop:1685 length:411 start_codon:yes stop_codon:yes gene_type:complete